MNFKMKKSITVYIALILTLSLCSSAYPQDGRSNMPVPAAEVYKNMLVFAKNGDGTKVEKSLLLLNPVILEVNKRFCTRIDLEISNTLYKEDPISMTGAVTKLIVEDIRHLLMESVESIGKDLEKMGIRIRIAFTEYQTIDPILEKKDFSASTKIKTDFRKAYFLSEAKKFDELKETIKGIEAVLKKNFPEAFEKESCLKR